MKKDAKNSAQEHGYHWGDNASEGYYEPAEAAFAGQWENLIYPLIQDYLPGNSVIIDLAVGHGRNTKALLPYAKKLYAVDINEENLLFCQERFKSESNIEYVLTPGASLTGIRDNSIDFIYCFDAMVHFECDVVENYIYEFRRVLKDGGYGFCHHSNYSENPEGYFRDNPHWRNFMSKELFAHWLSKAGLSTVKQRVIDWDKSKDLDCLTLFKK